MVYFNAFVGALFLMLVAGTFAEGLVWVLLGLLHASKAVMLSGELITLIPLAVMAVFVYKMVLSVEKDILANTY